MLWNLTYLRARFYDESTGEFCSRDPLEYVDGLSQYRGYLVPGWVDPMGHYALCQRVAIVPEALTDCGGSQAAVQWEMRLAGETTMNGINGYVVQHVVKHFDIRDCDGNRKRPPYSIEFWEAWKVVDGVVYVGDTDVPMGERTDTFALEINWDNTRGYYTMRGEVTFIPGYELKYNPPWRAPGTPGHVPEAGDLPTWRFGGGPGRPGVRWSDWRDLQYPKRRRTLSAHWHCCPCDNIPTDVSGSTGWVDWCEYFSVGDGVSGATIFS